MTIAELAVTVDGLVVGNGGAIVRTVAEIEHAGDGDVTFLANPKYERFLATTSATCVLVRTGTAPGRDGQNLICVNDPYAAFAQAHRLFAPPEPTVPIGIHPTAVVAPTAIVAGDARVGAYCVIGERVAIGAGVALFPHVVLGDDVVIGENSTLHAAVTVYHGCRLGRNVIVHSGTVIGADGFGFADAGEGRREKTPQTGIVDIGDDVEIGACCTIDRAAIGVTSIGRGCKIDNLVMIAHNVSLGEDTVIVAQAGVSGSSKIGKRVILAGQAGVTGHVELADGVIVTAQSGVSKSLTKAGFYRGSPAREMRTFLRDEALVRRLPQLLDELNTLTERVNDLEARLSQNPGH